MFNKIVELFYKLKNIFFKEDEKKKKNKNVPPEDNYPLY
tara:strand:+ start:360 stop:476 length:117 start_codon:yes stop_codon:yes gene_type:complete